MRTYISLGTANSFIAVEVHKGSLEHLRGFDIHELEEEVRDGDSVRRDGLVHRDIDIVHPASVCLETEFNVEFKVDLFLAFTKGFRHDERIGFVVCFLLLLRLNFLWRERMFRRQELHDALVVEFCSVDFHLLDKSVISEFLQMGLGGGGVASRWPQPEIFLFGVSRRHAVALLEQPRVADNAHLFLVQFREVHKAV